MIRQIKKLFLCLALIASATGAAVAQMSDPFTVTGVRVDQTSQSAAQARNLAIADGQKQAFERLVERLTVEEDRALLPELSQSDIEGLVQDLMIEGEQRSAVRYIASLTVRFRANEVRALFDRSGVGYSDTMSGAVLVLPVLITQGRALLWDDPNPWRAAWERLDFETGLVPIEVPFGELADLTAIDAASALAGNQVRLSAIGQRYNAPRAAVMRAEPFGPAGAEGLAVTMVLHGAQGLEQTLGFSIAATDPAVDGSNVYGRAVTEAVKRLEEDWKQRSVLDSGLIDSLSFTYPINSLADWVEMRQRLDRLGAVVAVRADSINRRQVTGRIDFRGDPGGLQFALQQDRLTLAETAPGSGEYRLEAAPSFGQPSPRSVPAVMP